MDLEIVISQDRSGYYPNPNFSSTTTTDNQLHCHDTNGRARPSPLALDPLQLAPIANPLDWSSYPYPFIYNQIDPELFPIDSWRECSRQVLVRKKMPEWMSDSVESDSPRLIQQLQQRLLSYRGIYADDNEILITLGAQNALFIVGMLLAPLNRLIAVENPTYHGVRNAFTLTGNTIAGVPVDKDGLIPSRIPTGSQLVFTTPSHQFPTMVTMSQYRRDEFLAAAVREDFLILEDDYEAEMNYLVRSTPSLRAMDGNDRVIYVGSMSKTISPGIRLGFMVAHRDIIREARLIRGVMMRHPPAMIQEIVARFLQLGHYDAHLRNIERCYKSRWSVMRDAIDKELGMLEKTDTEGGTSFWLSGPETFNATELSRRLRSRGVLIDNGQSYYLNNDNLRGFRLGFAYVPADKIADGISIIANEVKQLL